MKDFVPKDFILFLVLLTFALLHFIFSCFSFIVFLAGLPFSRESGQGEANKPFSQLPTH